MGTEDDNQTFVPQALDPTPLKASLVKWNKMFSSWGQQDAQECLVIMLDAIEEEYKAAFNDAVTAAANRVVHAAGQPGSDSGALSPPPSVLEKVERIVPRCPVGQFIKGEYTSIYTCDGCKSEIRVPEAFNVLSMYVNASPSQCSVEGLLNGILTSEKFERPCPDKCGSTSTTLDTIMSRVPEYTLLHLKRTAMLDGRFASKIKSAVRITKCISLRQMCNINHDECGDSAAGADQGHTHAKKEQQKIIGVVDHIGPSATSGHYTSSVRDADGKWWYCNDADVWEQQLDVDGRQAYLLAYKKEHS